MKKILVRYKLKSDMVTENETLVKKVYEQLREKKIEGFHYCTLKLADGISFMHIALAETEEANATFSHLPAFKSFQENIKDRCGELPVVSAVTVIGAYDFQVIGAG